MHGTCTFRNIHLTSCISISQEGTIITSNAHYSSEQVVVLAFLSCFYYDVKPLLLSILNDRKSHFPCIIVQKHSLNLYALRIIRLRNIQLSHVIYTLSSNTHYCPGDIACKYLRLFALNCHFLATVKLVMNLLA